MTGISIIVPTIGRPSLTQTTLPSILSQVTDLDQVIVVFDGWDHPTDGVSEMLQAAPCEHAFCRIQNLGRYGHPARNWAIDNVVSRPRMMTIDDDDVYLPGALDVVRSELHKHPPTVHVFGCRWGEGHPAAGTVLPRGRGLMKGEIATPMIVAPTCLARFGTDQVNNEAGMRTLPGYFGDYDYAVALSKIFPVESWVWHPDKIICEVRP